MRQPVRRPSRIPRTFGIRRPSQHRAFLAGLQLGYNWQVATRWVVGIQGDASYLDSNGTFTCMQASAQLIGSNCQVTPRLLASLTGRVGYLIDPMGHTLVYGKGGTAWIDSDISVTPNNTSQLQRLPERTWNRHRHRRTRQCLGLDGRRRHRARANAGLVDRRGIRLLSFRHRLCFEPGTIASSGTNDPDTTPPKFSSVAGSRSGVTSDMQVVKLALNYRWGQDPAAAWADVPVLAVAVMPVKARRALNSGGLAGRCWRPLLVQHRQGEKHQW